MRKIFRKIFLTALSLLIALPVHAQGIAQLGSGQLWGNSTAGNALAAPTTVTGIIDRAISSTRGTLLTRQTSAWVGLAPGTAGLPLLSAGAGADLAYGQVNLSAAVTGTLPLANGGTNANLTASNGGLFYSTATAGAILAGTATAGKILRSGANAAPSWSDVVIDSNNNILQGTVQEFVAADRTYFIRTDGNNSNTGLANSAGGAWLTWQKCADVIATLFIPNGVTVTCDGGNSGTFTGAGAGAPLAGFAGWAGGGRVVLTGDTGTPGNVILNANGGPAIRVFTGATIGTGMTIQGFHLIGASGPGLGGVGIRHGGRGTIDVVSMEFGSEAFLQVEFGSAAINMSGTNAIVGNVGLDRFYDADVGYIQAQGTVNIGGTVTIATAFGVARNDGYLFDVSTTYNVTGSVTGPRFLADKDGRINTQNNGLSVFPGSTAGTLATGGTYDGILGTQTVISSSATALSVGRLGATTPAFQVDASAGTSITGIRVLAAAASGGVALSAIGETDVALAINARGSGTISLNQTATGAVTTPRQFGSSLTTDATSATTGAIITAGGISTEKQLWAGTGIRILAQTAVPGLLSVKYTTAADAITLQPSDSDTVTSINFRNIAGTQNGSISHTSSATAFNTSSDGRLKPVSGRKPVIDARKTIDALRVYDFAWRDSQERGIGVVAQEAALVFPNMITKGDDDSQLSPTNEKFKGWGADYSKIVPILIVALQDANQRIDALERARR